MVWFEVRAFPAELGSCMVSLPALPFPNGGSLGERLSELYAGPAEFGSCMVSLLRLPFPKGGSLGGMLELVCAIAAAANTEVNAAAKRNFFTIFSVVFRCAGWATQIMTYVPTISKRWNSFVLLHFIAGAFDVAGPLN
jgi:hypothetical protein